jgi:hypothetical protein
MAGASVSIINSNSVQYNIKPSYLGNDVFRINYTNGVSTSFIEVSMKVSNVKITTLAISPSVLWKPLLSGYAINVTKTAVSTDGDSITVVSCGNGSKGTTTLVGTNCIYTPTSPFKGTDTFSYVLSDGIEQTTSTVTVTSTNTVPSIKKKTITITSSQFVSGYVFQVIDGGDTTGDSGETWCNLTITAITGNGSISIISPTKVTLNSTVP